jgi:hypothetical protein
MNRVLRILFELKMEEVPGAWKQLYEEIHNLYSSSYTTKVVKSSRMRWERQIAWMQAMKK